MVTAQDAMAPVSPRVLTNRATNVMARARARPATAIKNAISVVVPVKSAGVEPSVCNTGLEAMKMNTKDSRLKRL